MGDNESALFGGGMLFGAILFGSANLLLWDNDKVYQSDIDQTAALCAGQGEIVNRTITSHEKWDGQRHVEVQCEKATVVFTYHRQRK